ncbi:hypothetical protein MTR67_020645 [Solanum verrucosum]|uniref:Uncharacterized protein n=1 Tax=Solanum verrucosum TaxID=315347 RepID=A0AAF0QRF3_SOLVR|nr:hypothetical protein MTR67_020645 [Solanum verrucosum]
MPSISSTFNHAMLMSKVTNDGRDYVGCYIIFSLDMCPELVECDGYDLKCLVSRSNLVGNGIILHVWDPGIHRQLVKLNHLNSGILFHTQTQDILVNAKQLKRPVCALTVHQGESFLVGGGIEKRVVRRWNSQKLDHQQIFEIVRQKHEHVLARWTTERCVCIDVFSPHTVTFSNANVAENVTFDIALVRWLLIYSLQRIVREDKILVKATLNIYPSLNKFAAMIFILFYPNLEDKVLIQDGGIVVNQVDFVRAYVLEVVNGSDLDEILGPSKILEGFIWDPGPIIHS